jgi:hypothetical protein
MAMTSLVCEQKRDMEFPQGRGDPSPQPAPIVVIAGKVSIAVDAGED